MSGQNRIAITGIAEAFYGRVPNPTRETVLEKLDDPLAEIVREFEQRFQK